MSPRPRTNWCIAACLFLGIAICGCENLPGPIETTDDGLERVASRKLGGVYRAPGAPFTQYTRLMLEPLTVNFVRDFERQHSRVPKTEWRRIREEAQTIFREEFTRELIKRGKYEYADASGPDVLMVSPSVVDLDLVIPDGNEAETQTLAPGPAKMQIVSELRDGATGQLVGRIIMFSGGEPYPFNQLRVANRTTNAHDERVAFGKYVMLVREALNVAKTERPRPPKPPQIPTDPADQRGDSTR